MESFNSGSLEQRGPLSRELSVPLRRFKIVKKQNSNSIQFTREGTVHCFMRESVAYVCNIRDERFDKNCSGNQCTLFSIYF